MAPRGLTPTAKALPPTTPGGRACCLLGGTRGVSACCCEAALSPTPRSIVSRQRISVATFVSRRSASRSWASKPCANCFAIDSRASPASPQRYQLSSLSRAVDMSAFSAAAVLRTTASTPKLPPALLVPALLAAPLGPWTAPLNALAPVAGCRPSSPLLPWAAVGSGAAACLRSRSDSRPRPRSCSPSESASSDSSGLRGDRLLMIPGGVPVSGSSAGGAS